MVSALHITDDVMTSTATQHYANRCPKGWAVTWLGDRTVTRNEAITAMMIAVEVATKDLDADQVARWLVDDLAGELDLGMFEAIAMVTGIEATRDLPGFVGDALDQGREDEYEAQLEAERTAALVRFNRLTVLARTEGPRTFGVLTCLLGILAAEAEDEQAAGGELFTVEEVHGFLDSLLDADWRPVAEALDARLAEIEAGRL